MPPLVEVQQLDSYKTKNDSCLLIRLVSKLMMKRSYASVMKPPPAVNTWFNQDSTNRHCRVVDKAKRRRILDIYVHKDN